MSGSGRAPAGLTSGVEHNRRLLGAVDLLLALGCLVLVQLSLSRCLVGSGLGHLGLRAGVPSLLTMMRNVVTLRCNLGLAQLLGLPALRRRTRDKRDYDEDGDDDYDDQCD
jgi:hypothetical protein